jgi:hypothetical protein
MEKPLAVAVLIIVVAIIALGLATWLLTAFQP